MGSSTMVQHTSRTVVPHQKLHLTAKPSYSEPWRNQTSKPQGAQLSNLAPDVLEFGYLNLAPDCVTVLKEARKTITRAC